MDADNLLLDLYSAPGSREKWFQSVESVASFFNCKAGVYLLINQQDQKMSASYWHGYTDEDFQAYIVNGGASTDPRYQFVGNIRPGEVCRDIDYIPSLSLIDEAEWNQYEYNKYGTYYNMTAFLSTHGVWADYLSLNREKKEGKFTLKDKKRYYRLVPHLARAAEIHRSVSRLYSAYQAVLSVVDRLLVGLIILDEKNRVIIANSTACSIGEQSGSYILANGRMVLRDRSQVPRFDKLLSDTALTSSGQKDCDGGRITLQSIADRKSSIMLEIMPIRDDGFVDRDNVRGTVIFVIDPEQSTHLSAYALKAIFGLTQSETNVVESLINGLRVPEIAEQRRTNEDTIRKQLKSAYQKSGSSGQLELLRKAILANPPIQKTKK